MHMKKHFSSKQDTNQGEGKIKKLKFAAKQLNDRILLHTLEVPNKYSELPTTPDHDQTSVNQSDEFPAPSLAVTSFWQISQRKCTALNPRDNPEEEDEIHQEQVYEV